MAVSTTNGFDGPYAANGVTTSFPFTFTAPTSAEVSVLLRDADGIESVAAPALYTVTLGTVSGGSVVFSSAPATGSTLIVYLDPEFTQEIAFEDGSAWRASPVNETADRSASRDQALKRDIDRAVLSPIGESGLTLPSAALRPGKFLAFGADGLPYAADGTGADSGLRNDLVSTANGNGASLISAANGVSVQTYLNSLAKVTAVSSDKVVKGSLLHLANVAGGTTSWLALGNFAWTTLDAHVWKASPDIAVLRVKPPRIGTPPTPTGFTAPATFHASFTVTYNGAGAARTSFDDDTAFRTLFQPTVYNSGSALNAYYVDLGVGSDANSGKSWALAKATFANARAALNTSAQPGVIYMRSNGKCFSRSTGPGHTGIVTVDYAIIGVDDANGNPCYMGNTYDPADVTWSANATYAWVYETATATMTAPGRTCDLSVPIIEQDARGRQYRIPMEYAAKTTLAAVSSQPGSYWFDSANSKYYVHMIGAKSPVLNTDLVIVRSTAGVVPHITRAQTFYGENFRVLGDFAISNAKKIKTYLNKVMTLYAGGNGVSPDNHDLAVLKDCVTIKPTLDGFNYHNIGAVITAITQANPPVVTAAAHGFANGDAVQIGATSYGSSIGMDAVLGSYTIANVTTNTFELAGANSTGFAAYTTGGKARGATSRIITINPVAIKSGIAAGSNQSSTTHENVEVIEVNPVFSDCWRDHCADTNYAKAWRIGGVMLNTQVTADTNRISLATDEAKAAFDSIEWGGHCDPATTAFQAQGLGVIRLLNMDLPTYSQQVGVSLSW